MLLVIHFFARAKDLAETDQAQLDLPVGATIGDLRKELARKYPRLGPLLDRSALAVNNEFAEDGMVLEPGAEVALLPPVSGG
jgi:molybdopterin converting factor subunit 1